MFDRLRNLFSGKEINGASQADKEPDRTGQQDAAFQQLNQLAPLAEYASSSAPAGNSDTQSASGETAKSFICREAVLNHEQRVAGYEFRLNKAKRDRMRHSSDSIHRLYDEVLIRNVMMMNIDRLLGHRIAFIPLSFHSLDNLLIEHLPASNTVLVFECSADMLKDAQSILSRLQEFRDLGFRIGLSHYAEKPGMQPFLDFAEFMLIDVSDRPLPDITTELNAISRNAFSKKLVAQDIESLEMFQVCKKLPFTFFQGSFVTRREKWEKPRADTGRLKVLELMNQVRRNAEISEVAALFRQDPVLSYKILRYINSPAGGLSKPAATLEQALLILGQQQLYRWLTLLLFVSGNVEELDAALMENALVRARLTELLGTEKMGAGQKEDLFVTGMFSLLDVLLRLPMSQALENLQLPGAVAQALIAHEGPLAPYLELAIACEEFDAKKIAQLSRLLELDVDRVNINHIDALVWAQSLDAGPA
ncbi:MAG: HDOD domain-containing protein [Sulfurimicrobium sp.]|nr:HDOD domain-containing protein [Sulfurimicrobium sp.]MDO9190535.1 HDOD domain-containing protein [Sulfurimicrobium sp.]MDP1705720.1 HDOD domain-containing protein [Sulfurimicrobium sp.]MDP2200236.1 HDOD domain-containing protein [Sulfurimicrobium sp.]MDP2962973.1 HDOD domain-containing protein [Sulfurimicrobium sp.]